MHKITNLWTEHGYNIIKVIKQVTNTEIHLHYDNEINFHTIYVLLIYYNTEVLFNKQCLQLYYKHFRDKKI